MTLKEFAEEVTGQTTFNPKDVKAVLDAAFYTLASLETADACKVVSDGIKQACKAKVMPSRKHVR